MKKLGRLFVVLVSLVSCVAVFVAPAYAKSAKASTPIVVSMGDSFASGEGVDPFYGQDSGNKYYNQDWLAHRSQSSWSSQLVIDGYRLSTIKATPTSTPVVDGSTITYPLNKWTGGTWFFVAASGATTLEIYDRNEYNVYNVSRPREDLSGYVSYTARLAPQIEIFDYIDATYGKGSVDYVTIGMGGLELGYSDTLVSAGLTSATLQPNALNDSFNELKEYYKSTLSFQIRDALLAVCEAAGSQAKVIFVGYPELFSGGGFSLLFEASEMEQGNAFVDWLDAQLKLMVQQLNASGLTNLYYVSVIDSCSGHGSYASDAWVNGIVFGPTSEDLNYSEIKYIVSPGSFHPNKKGTAAIAAEVQKLIDRLEAAGRKPGWAIRDGAYVYYENDGSLRKNAWISLNGNWYYFGNDGKLVTNTWVSLNGDWYYFGNDGKLVSNAWVSLNGNWYYFGSDSKLVANAWLNVSGNWYYFGNDAQLVTNSWLNLNGGWYYFDKDSKAVISDWVNYNGSYYYLGKDGRALSNSWINYKGSYYYLGKDGKVVTNSWVNYNGSYYYLKANGKPAVSETLTIGGKQYSFNNKGVCTWKSA